MQRWWSSWIALVLGFSLLSAGTGGSESLEQAPSSPSDSLDLGLDALDAGDWPAAIGLFSQLSAEFPGEAEIFYLLGVAWASSGNDLAAVEAFAVAADIDPELDWVQADLGVSLYRLGESELAEDYLLEALLQGPEDADVLLHLGLIDLESGNSARGNRMLEESAELDPGIGALAFYHAANFALDRDDIPQAIDFLERAALARGPEGWRLASAELLAALAAGEADARRIRLSAAVGFENDDNLTVSEQDFSTGIGDIAGTFEADIEVEIIQEDSLDLSVGYDFFQSLHQDLKAFDLQAHEPHIQISGATGALQSTLTYAYRREAYRDVHYLDSNLVELDLNLCGWRSLCGVLGASFERIDFAPTPGRDSNRYTLIVGQQASLWQGRVAFSLSWEPQWQRARNDEFSYDSQIVNAGLTAFLDPFRKGMLAGVSYEFESRDYEGADPDSKFAREDDRHVIWAGVRVPLIGPTQISLDYLLIMSGSTISALNYDENIVSLKLWAWR